MSIQYNILWIDDEYKELEDLEIQAERYDIVLHGFTSFEEGFKELDSNLEFYDGVLLDAMFYEYKDQEKGTEDGRGLSKAIKQLVRLENRKELPMFVLSGKTAYTRQDNETLKNNDIYCYEKGNNNELIKLFQKIHEAADKQFDTQLKHIHAKAFAACSEPYIGKSTSNDLLNIIKELENNNLSTELLNPVRQIIEDLLKALNKYKLLPDAFVKKSVSLTAASKFLSGKEEFGYTLKEESKPPVSICDELYFVLHIVQSGSHSSELKQRLKSQQTPYLAAATVNVLLDILVWFKEYIDSNPKQENWTESETAKYNAGDWIEGVVSASSNGYGNFINQELNIRLSILPRFMIEYNLSDNDKIEIQRDENNTNHIKEIRK